MGNTKKYKAGYIYEIRYPDGFYVIFKVKEIKDGYLYFKDLAGSNSNIIESKVSLSAIAEPTACLGNNEQIIKVLYGK